ncbi:hypothetical protein FHS51_000770 [Sphingobium wenxiniae]|nr:MULTISPECIES: hypothetical protein [Sphingobium]MBB6190557.1 hypothetical protein [Sphingobium wenxiniae]WRD78061.1 hypothetical protein QQ987_08230 [Sphingobium baderi]
MPSPKTPGYFHSLRFVDLSEIGSTAEVIALQRSPVILPIAVIRQKTIPRSNGRMTILPEQKIAAVLQLDRHIFDWKPFHATHASILSRSPGKQNPTTLSNAAQTPLLTLNMAVLALELAGSRGLHDSPLRFVELQVGYRGKDFTNADHAAGIIPKRDIFFGVSLNIKDLFFKNSRSRVARRSAAASTIFRCPTPPSMTIDRPRCAGRPLRRP